jgi:hypothetical protein
VQLLSLLSGEKTTRRYLFIYLAYSFNYLWIIYRCCQLRLYEGTLQPVISFSSRVRHFKACTALRYLFQLRIGFLPTFRPLGL